MSANACKIRLFDLIYYTTKSKKTHVFLKILYNLSIFIFIAKTDSDDIIQLVYYSKEGLIYGFFKNSRRDGLGQP